MLTTDHVPFENSYAELPEELYARVMPTPVRDPELIRLNRPLAQRLGLDPDVLASPEGVQMLAGNRVPHRAEPLAMAYAGHQFGAWVPRLGDGRAILLGDLVEPGGARVDLQLKGAGRTPFSRRGDGRAGLGPVMREFMASEAMAALGIPTTRALAMLKTGEWIYRQRPEPGALLARVAGSHVRVGTFEYAFRRERHDTLRALADYVIARHTPHLAGAEGRYRALLAEVVQRTADLVASWMLVGFVHGVMNTDNMSIAGETIDYGPFAFLDSYHPDTVFSSIDFGGRYAFGQQPNIAYWNLQRFAQTLVPLLSQQEDDATGAAAEALDPFASRFRAVYHAGLRRKLGLAEELPEDVELATSLLERMAEQRADFTLTFRRLCDVAARDSSGDEPVRALFDDPTSFDTWVAAWRRRLRAETRDDAARRAAMRAVNPAYVLRNHLAQRAVDAADAGDFGPMDDLMTVLADPFSDHPALAAYAAPPAPDEVVPRTFCGT